VKKYFGSVNSAASSEATMFASGALAGPLELQPEFVGYAKAGCKYVIGINSHPGDIGAPASRMAPADPVFGRFWQTNLYSQNQSKLCG
jgi:hypothetical protein